MGLLEFENINEELEKEIEILSQNYKLYKKEYLLKRGIELEKVMWKINILYQNIFNFAYS